MQKEFYTFNSQVVINATNKATRQVLSKFGAYVRQSAKRSIVKRKKVSAPGSPPSSHSGHLKKNIFFGYDTSAKSVVIGPTKLNDGKVPNALEYGGVRTISKRKGKRGQRYTVTYKAVYRPRPFMQPAYNKEFPRFKKLVKDCIK